MTFETPLLGLRVRSHLASSAFYKLSEQKVVNDNN